MKIVKLGDVCEFKRGLTYKKADEVVVSDNIVLRANNIDISSFQLNFDELKYINNSIEIPRSKYIAKNTILICTASGSKSHLGKVAFVDEDYGYAFGGFMGLITPDESEIHAKFLYRVLTAKPFRDLISNLTDGANINNLKFGDIQNFEFVLPSLEEQEKIVAKLDAAHSKIAEAEVLMKQNIANVSLLQKSILAKYLDSANDTHTHRLGDLCSFVNGDRGKNYPSKSKQTTSGVPFINAGHLTDNGLDMTHMNYISQETYSKLGSGKIKPHDILYCLRGSLGKFASVGELQEGAIASSLVIVRPDETKLLNSYLLYYFGSDQAIAMIDKFRNGAAQPNLSARNLASYVISVPSRDEQIKIVSKLDELLAQVAELQRHYTIKLTKLVGLRQSLLAEAFAS